MSHYLVAVLLGVGMTLVIIGAVTITRVFYLERGPGLHPATARNTVLVNSTAIGMGITLLAIAVLSFF